MSLGGGEAPPDNSLALYDRQQRDARAAQALQDKKDAERKAELAALRSSSAAGARTAANNYFTNLGLDPTAHATSIDDFINQTLSSIAPDDPNPGAYFNNLGSKVAAQDQAAQQGKYTRLLNQLFPSDFSSTKLPGTTDDDVLASILGTQRSDADAIIQNMLKRGVINQTGATAAEGDLDRQTAGVKGKLNELGASTLAQGQQSLDDIISGAKKQAGTLDLDASFDPYSYTGKVDTQFTDFMNNIGDKIRAKLTGPLFNTSGLGVIAGSAQGAQNFKFDPNAVNGIIAGQTGTGTQQQQQQPNSENVF